MKKEFLPFRIISTILEGESLKESGSGTPEKTRLSKHLERRYLGAKKLNGQLIQAVKKRKEVLNVLSDCKGWDSPVLRGEQSSGHIKSGAEGGGRETEEV